MPSLRKWTGGLLALGLIGACAWGSADALRETIPRGYFGDHAYTIILHSLKYTVNASLLETLTVLLPAIAGWTLSYVLLLLFGYPPARADVGAAIWTLLLPATAAIGYYINKTDWYPDFSSIGGILANAALLAASVTAGFAAWSVAAHARDVGARALARMERCLGLRGAVAAAIYVMLLNGAFYVANSRSTATAEAHSASSPRVVVIGLDGASWRVIDPLLRAGKLPSFERLMSAGTYRELTTFEPTLSPIIWTTAATGKPMSEHGIEGFTVKRGPDQGKLVTSNMRRVKALWNILSDYARSVGVVGWFVTWPAEPINGFMVSSYAGAGRISKGKLEKNIPQLVYPAPVLEEIAPAMTRAQVELDDQFRRVFPRLGMAGLTSSQKSVVADTREVLLTDLMNANAGVDLYRNHRPDLFAIYLAGIDVISHRFWKYKYPGDLSNYRFSSDDVKMFSDAIDNYVILTDDLIGRYLTVLDDDTTVIVMSDHGMGPYMPADADDDRLSGHHHDGQPGILIMSGRTVTKGRLRAPASVFDIAPTVLYLLDLPLADDMTGMPILAALDTRVARNQVPRYVRTYETGPPPALPSSALETGIDDHLKDRLKSLGYL